jgi:tetratricopeptide (TPR) repeat protein
MFLLSAVLFFGMQGIYPQTGEPSAGEFSEVKASPVFSELAAAGHDSDYTWETLAEMALCASAVQYLSGGERLLPEIESYMQKIRTAVGMLLAGDIPADMKERGDFILKFMHGSFLKSYSVNQTRLDLLLDTGRYNCVSSAVLYMILAIAAGLDAEGVLVPEHAFVSVNIGRERIDVEATTRYGFDPGAQQEFHDAFSGMTGFVYVPAENYRQRAAISRVELVSLIFSNRLSELLRANKITETLPLAMDYAALLSSRNTPVSSNMFSNPETVIMEALINYGSALSQQKKYTKALEWAVFVAATYREESFWNDASWQDFYSTALYNVLALLLNEGKVGEARNLLTAHNTWFTLPDYDTLDSIVLIGEVQELANSVSSADGAAAALAAIDAALKHPVFSSGPQQSSGAANRQVLEKLRIFVLLREGERRADESGEGEAISYLEAAEKQYGGNAQIAQALKVYRNNRIVTFHNEFAGLYNSGKYQEAAEAARQGLAEFPDNRQLKTDLTLAEKAVRAKEL